MITLFFVCSCKENLPIISSIEPHIGSPGELLTITGENFGEERDESSYVTIAGAAPTSSSYVSWKNSLIQVRIPEFAEAGLVYIHRGGKKSNPVLFSYRSAMPEPVRGEEFGSLPRIQTVEPASAPIGALVTIHGANFGASRENSGVFFAWNAETRTSSETEAKAPEAVEAFDTEFAYELWSEREIRVRVPDGAVSGNLEVRTPRGNSRPAFFEISGKPGTKIYKDKRSYTFSYSVDVMVERAVRPNGLYLWLPKPVSSASQRNINVLNRSSEPFIENYRGSSLYQLMNLDPGTKEQINLSYVAEVYAVESGIRYQNIRQDGTSPIKMVYTQSAPMIPSDDPDIAAQAGAIVGRERNPYIKAQKIFQWILKEKDLQAAPLPGGALEGLKETGADSYRASLLFCALARAADVPAIPAAGVLVDRNQRAVRHYWAEFWIDSFGWIPVDPALSAGAAPDGFLLREDHGTFYFGSLDNQRITFSRGQSAISQMDARGRITARSRDYSLQNLWEEATGGLESYSSLWSDVTITGLYIQ
ncbi:MAG: IPT/TIG domain-containing protein [Treponema sp.]|nr:IPT/TIG domain-containing protein [Treponema sp.]